MISKDIKITFIGMKLNSKIKKYCLEKISKYATLWKEATNMEVYLKKSVNSRGIKNTYRMDINIYLPNTDVRVEQTDEDIYACIDKGTDILARRLNRYHDKRSYWEGRNSWKELAIKNEEDILDEYYTYIPKIVTRKEIKSLRQMEESEAIESMELAGFNQLMFINRNTGKISMVYRREEGNYGLLEVQE